MGFIDFALVHHANQYLITNGYQNREGLNEVLGFGNKSTGYLRVFKLHEKYKIPFNLHLSGTLLEAILWHSPDFLEELKSLRNRGLLDFVGSCYGQNIMPFFARDHNLRQLNEGLMLYREHLAIDPQSVRVFWPPERVWDTKRIGPVLIDSSLLNGGYEYVLMDDRLFGPPTDRAAGRELDRMRAPHSIYFTPCLLANAGRLTALPISFPLRQNIPPYEPDGLDRLQDLFHWLEGNNPASASNLIAVYGDDLEKAAGCCGWNQEGPERYEAFLDWLSRIPNVRPVKLNEWAARSDSCPYPIEAGTYFEMSHHFGAGEDYAGWFHDEKWESHQSLYTWSEKKTAESGEKDADPALMDLAWKHLLASSWETAWHTPSYGVHGAAASNHEPSPWARALASHSRHAALIAEAAYWMNHPDGTAHAYVHDIDHDGHKELILRNDFLFAVFSPLCGGRLIYLFDLHRPEGKMVIGNPSDDWNWQEELNGYMKVPANHPGALAERGGENDRFESLLMEDANGAAARAALFNREEKSRLFGLEKRVRLVRDASEIEVRYRFPPDLESVTVECGFSPDYLHLLRFGRAAFREYADRNLRAYSNHGVSVWARLEHGGEAVFGQKSREFGHGCSVEIHGRKNFMMWIGTGRTVSS